MQDRWDKQKQKGEKERGENHTERDGRKLWTNKQWGRITDTKEQKINFSIIVRSPYNDNVKPLLYWLKQNNIGK